IQCLCTADPRPWAGPVHLPPIDRSAWWPRLGFEPRRGARHGRRRVAASPASFRQSASIVCELSRSRKRIEAEVNGGLDDLIRFALRAVQSTRVLRSHLVIFDLRKRSPRMMLD